MLDWDKDHVDLQWSQPETDGGAPIKSYVIEKREKDTGKWIRAVEVTAPHLHATVPDLDENTEYEFRVRAVNEAGPSAPSKPSKSVITKQRKCEYSAHRAFDKLSLKSINHRPFLCFYRVFSGTEN